MMHGIECRPEGDVLIHIPVLAPHKSPRVWARRLARRNRIWNKRRKQVRGAHWRWTIEGYFRLKHPAGKETALLLFFVLVRGRSRRICVAQKGAA